MESGKQIGDINMIKDTMSSHQQTINITVNGLAELAHSEYQVTEHSDEQACSITTGVILGTSGRRL